jgi:biopolymer transport protein ExbD
MAFGRLKRRSGHAPMSDINMTPLIDVMLVLLVIFIMAAPLMVTRLTLNLPRLDGAAPTDVRPSLQLTLDAQSRLYLAEQPISIEGLGERAAQAAASNPATEVHLRADSRVPYGTVAEVISRVQKAGLTRIGFVTEPAAARGPDSGPVSAPQR